MKIAIIDLGSNSVRMTVWQCSREKNEVIYNGRKYVRLSEGLSSDNFLKEAPIERTLAALTEFKATIDSLSCERVCAVATEAVRRAENGREFAERVRTEFGFDLRVLSGADESRYDFYASLDLVNSSALIMDVGGGSLELIRCNSDSVLKHTCMPHGAVVMTDRFGTDFSALADFFTRRFSRLDMLKGASESKIIGLGGSIRALFDWASQKKQGMVMPTDRLIEAILLISKMPTDELSQIPAFSERADVIKAGLAPFYALARVTGAKEIVLNNHGVREGILFECLKLKS